jgi:coenzyme F420 biosynthesis associated uncharacterized protein
LVLGRSANSDCYIIDWPLAASVARAVAGSGSGKRSIRRADLARAARGSGGLVRRYTGLEPPGRLPSPELVDRREWIDANLASLRAMSAGVEDRLGESLDLPGPFGGALRRAAGVAAAVELGLASGYMAQRVLGQYDIVLIGPRRPPRLLFVAPNLDGARRRLGADREPFLRWVALHESTHAVQFGAVPWLREHLGGIAEDLLNGAFARLSVRDLAVLVGRALSADPRRLLAGVRDGEWLSPFVPEPRRRMLADLQATMALVEGYSEHVMDAVGEDLDPAYRELREGLEQSRSERSLLEAFLSRLLGMELKLRQYRLGKAFCDEVAERRGIGTLNRVWEEPAALPRLSELRRPGRWLGRVG